MKTRACLIFHLILLFLLLSIRVGLAQNNITNPLKTLTSNAYKLYLDKPDSAIYLTRKALDLAISSFDTYYEGYCYFLFSKVYWVKANYKLSTEFGFKALKFFDNPTNFRERSSCLLSLARTITDLGNFKRARQLIDEVLKLGIMHSNERIMADAYRELSYLLLELNLLDSALYVSDKGIWLFDKLGDSLEAGVLYGRKSIIYFRQKDFKNSKAYALHSLIIDSLVNNRRALGVTYHILAQNEYALKNIGNAISHLKNSIRINGEIGNIIWLIKSHELLSLIYFGKKRPDLAATELQKAIKFKDDLFNSVKDGHIQEMHALHELEAKQNTIQSLQKKSWVEKQKIENQNFFLVFLITGILLLVLLIIALARLRAVQNKTNQRRQQHLIEINDLKTRFFTSISHEFRTPITLIIGPLKDFYKKASQEDQKVFGIMVRNCERLLRLINQLLDLSKIEAGKMRLHTSPVELVEFLKELASSYESFAINKKIKYFFYPEMQELIVYIDYEKIEKVVHNLLSNAFKFTKEGEVILNLKAEKNQCLIVVKDTGIGIPSDQVDKVFDRFYQVDSSLTRGYEGSGLGIALAKELVELHKGKISVESKEGMGTTFTVSLPLGKEHLSKEEITDSGFRKSEILSDVIISEETRLEIRNENETVPFDSHPVLLIVEDNTDMRHYIRKTLSDQYQILEAENGKIGVEKASEIIPDLIISDIMMPVMDGYKLCELIRNNELTSHIPIILLTAKADRESKLSGLEIGADDYLSKPFDADELKLIVHNRIEERRKMRERFSREVTLEPRHISITSLDEKFLTKVLAIIETHMADENFSIDELSREAAYSNIHFYRKIKALSGQTPSVFMRTIRLKRAAELLTRKSDNVSQIAYSVGFSSLSYFNKCFKEQFGVTPGQFAEEKSKV